MFDAATADKTIRPDSRGERRVCRVSRPSTPAGGRWDLVRDDRRASVASTGQLTGAARQPPTAARNGRIEPTALETIANEFKNFLGARADDSDEFGLGRELG